MRVHCIEDLLIPEESYRAFESALEEKGHTFKYFTAPTRDPQELRRRSEGADIVILANTPYPKESFVGLDRLKRIQVAFTGLDHVDLEAARANHIEVINAAGYSDIAVAELVIGLAISFQRKLCDMDQAIRVGRGHGGDLGVEIHGKTCGIIGTGHIGWETARRFHAFGAKIIGYDPIENPKFLEIGGQYRSLDQLLGESDIVTVHCPQNEQTRHLLSKDEFSKMKPSALLINCARGPIVHTEDLIVALREKQIAGACLDVFDSEPPLSVDDPLFDTPALLLTPHIAYRTEEAMVRRADIVFQNTLDYCNQ